MVDLKTKWNSALHDPNSPQRVTATEADRIKVEMKLETRELQKPFGLQEFQDATDILKDANAAAVQAKAVHEEAEASLQSARNQAMRPYWIPMVGWLMAAIDGICEISTLGDAKTGLDRNLGTRIQQGEADVSAAEGVARNAQVNLDSAHSVYEFVKAMMLAR